MHLVICIDSNKSFLKQCCVMLFSLLKNNQDDQIILHVIHTPEAKAMFDQHWELLSHFVASVHVTLWHYSIDWDLVSKLHLPVYNKLPLTTYFRLLIPKLLDSSIEKCLYLDGDCIIRKNLSELYSLNMEDGRVSGVMTNVLTSYMENLSISKYINAGVLLINLKAWRANNVASQCIDFIQQYPNGLRGIQPIMGDQCAINYVCRDHMVVTLEPTRNTTPMRFGNSKFKIQNSKGLGYDPEKIMLALTDPSVLHFAGTRKPCEWICFHPWKLTYYYYLFESGLIDWTDFVKVIWHWLSYPLRTDGFLYQGLKRLRIKLIKR